jgi:hypothetical protein
MIEPTPEQLAELARVRAHTALLRRTLSALTFLGIGAAAGTLLAKVAREVAR